MLRSAPLLGVALAVGPSVIPVSGGVATAVDATVRAARVAAADDSAISAFGHDTAVAEVRAVTADIQLNVVGGSRPCATDTDCVAECDSVRPSSDRKSMSEIDAILGFAL